jgi:hypothetical protein
VVEPVDSLFMVQRAHEPGHARIAMQGGDVVDIPEATPPSRACR